MKLITSKQLHDFPLSKNIKLGEFFNVDSEPVRTVARCQLQSCIDEVKGKREEIVRKFWAKWEKYCGRSWDSLEQDLRDEWLAWVDVEIISLIIGEKE